MARKPTKEEIISNLITIVSNRRSRMEALRTSIPTSKPKDQKWMREEIQEHEKFLAETEKRIKEFSKSYYAPAIR